MFQVIAPKNSSQKGPVLLLVAALLVAIGILVPGTMVASPLAQSQGDLEHLKALSGKEFEIDFMSMMIEHHQSAIYMAKLAPDRASHQEIRDAAQDIVSSQTHEINDMTGWLRQWYGVAPKTGTMHDLPGMGMSDMTTLANLKGNEFDKAFLVMMRLHHLGAVAMADLVVERAIHDELKTLGHDVITSQSIEVHQFEGWLEAWYGLDVTGNSTPGGMTPPDSMSGGGTSGASAPGMPKTGIGGGDGPLIGVVDLAALLILAISTLAFGIRLRKRTRVN